MKRRLLTRTVLTITTFVGLAATGLTEEKGQIEIVPFESRQARSIELMKHEETASRNPSERAEHSEAAVQHLREAAKHLAASGHGEAAEGVLRQANEIAKHTRRERDEHRQAEVHQGQRIEELSKKVRALEERLAKYEQLFDKKRRSKNSAR